MEKKIGIACDHAGYEMKEFLIGYLGAKGYDVYDFGTDSPEAVDYADFAHPLAEAIEKGEFERGIALCGSGEGMAITLNKHQRIRAGLVWRKEIAELVKKHNNANVIVLPGTLHHQRRSGGVHRDLPHYRVRGRPSRTPHRQDSRQGPRIDRPPGHRACFATALAAKRMRPQGPYNRSLWRNTPSKGGV